jgi:hypothetical protein
MQIWINYLKNNIGKFTILALFIILWQTLQISASSSLDEEYSKNRHIDVIRQVSQSIIKPGDIVFLSSHNALIQQAVDRLGASVFKFDSIDAIGFEAVLIQVLDKYCDLDQEQDKPAIYFIWTLDNKQTIMELSNAARGLNFLFGFQALLPYKGSDVFVIDNILGLQPKKNIIHRYCEANKLSGTRQVLLVVDANEFSPWIGSVITGRITWLASDPARNMINSDFAVKDRPPLVSYDVYWSKQLNSNLFWTFENQDMAAYELSVEQAKTQNSLVLVDRQAKLGITALRYLKECDNEQSTIESELFHQVCIK